MAHRMDQLPWPIGWMPEDISANVPWECSITRCHICTELSMLFSYFYFFLFLFIFS